MDPVVLRSVLVLVGLAVLVLAGRWWQRRDGRITATDARDDRVRLRADQLDDVGLDLDGASAGALLLGSPTCAPCTTVKRILTEVADQRDGFRWTYADAADHLDIAEEHRVLRVPTLFLLDAEGRILARTSGVPAQQELTDVLDRGGEHEGTAA